MSKKSIVIITVIGAALFFMAVPLALRIAMFRNAQGKIVLNKASSSVDSRIYITNVIGLPTTQLSPKGNWDVDPVLSPDGTKIAFECHNPDFSLCIMNSDGSNRVQIDEMGGRPMSPNWSPDSQKVVFESSGIYVVDSDGSNLTQLVGTEGDINYWEPIWSPDGKQIAYVVIDGDNWDIYIMNSDGSEQRNLSNHAASDWSAIWSTDGTYIFFVSDRSGDDEIYRMDSDGSNFMNLTNSPGMSDYLGSISPDGQKIVFSVHDDNASAPDIDVYVMNSDGTGRRRLTDTPDYDSDPVWSPDGKHIAFISGRTGNWAVYVMRADGKFQTRISYGLSAESVSWQP